MTNDNADGAVETPTVEGLQESLRKAEAKIVDMKKSTPPEVKVEEKKAPETTEVPDMDTMLNAKLAERDFYSNNPDFEGYKDSIKELTSKGISYEVAMEEVKRQNPEFGNKEKIKSMNITTGTDGGSQNTYTKADLENMTQSEYNKVMNLRDQGKVVVT